MAAPTPSDLDFGQCIQGSYDDANGRLRVDAAITAPLDVDGEVLVDIRADDGDSVIIYGTQDGTPTGTIQPLKINPDGSIVVGSILGTTDVNVTNPTLAVTQSGTWTTGRTWTLLNSTDSVNSVQSGVWNLNNISGTISLPTGAATEATLSSLNSKIPSNLTVSSNRLLVDGSGVVQPVSGTVAVSNFPATQAVTQSTSPWVVSGTVSAVQSGAWSTGRTWTLSNATDSVNVGNFPATQNVNVTNATLAVTQSTSPWVVSGTVATTQSGTWNIGTVSTITNVVHVDDNAGSLTVDNNGTFATQAAQSGTWNITNISGTVSLPTGAATSANQITTNASLSSIDSKLTSPLSARITDGTDTALVTTNGEQKVVDGLRGGSVQGILTMTTANTAYEAKVGVSRLANRKFLMVYANAAMFWGIDNTVTSATGFPLTTGQVLNFSIDPDSTFQIWLVSTTASNTAIVLENP